MKRYYYITVNWDKELFYDGYFMTMEDDRIIGFTDEAILVGSATEIVEICTENTCRYGVQKRFYMDRPFCINIADVDHMIRVRIKEVHNITEEKIRERIADILQNYPESIQKSFIENYS